MYPNVVVSKISALEEHRFFSTWQKRDIFLIVSYRSDCSSLSYVCRGDDDDHISHPSSPREDVFFSFLDDLLSVVVFAPVRAHRAHRHNPIRI